MVNYFYNMKIRHHFFHGDIKLDNIFFDSSRSGFITSDSGSLLMVDPDDKIGTKNATTCNP